MTAVSVPDRVGGLDAELYKVGRAVVGDRAAAIVDHVHHQFCWCRKARFAWSAQWELPEIATPTRGVAANEDYEWRYTTGLNTRWVSVTILTYGSIASTSTRSGVQVTTSTGTTVFARPMDLPSVPAAGPNEHALQEWRSPPIEVAPNAVETIRVDQTSTTDLVRIVSIRVEELPIGQIDTAVDTWAGDYNQFAPALPIVAGTPGATGGAALPPAASTGVATLPALCQTLRRFHKQVIFSSAQQTSTSVVAVANRVDEYTKATPATRMLQWDLPESVTRPQSASRSVTCRVLAKSSANGGVVRFAFSGGTNIDVTVAAGAAAWTQATGNINKTGESVSVQIYQSGAGTLTVFNRTVEEDVEAT